MLTRAEEQRDWAALHAMNVSAFETPAEADLVAALPEQARPFVSLIAEDNGFGIGCEYEVPEEVFMVAELQADFLHCVSGEAKYHAAFSDEHFVGP